MSSGSRLTRAKAALAAATTNQPKTEDGLEETSDTSITMFEELLLEKNNIQHTTMLDSTENNHNNYLSPHALIDNNDLYTTSVDTKPMDQPDCNPLISSPKVSSSMTPIPAHELTPLTPSHARATPPASITNSAKLRIKEELGSSEVTDLDLEGSVIPPLSHVVIKNLVSINDALIKICLEFQNKNWTNEPDYAIYQRRLQSNLTYLAAVADYYLNPKQPETSLELKIDMTPFPAPRIRSAKVLNSLLAQAMSDFQAKSAAIDPRLIILDRTAAVRASASMAQAGKSVPDVTSNPTTSNNGPNFPSFGNGEKLSTLKKYDPPTFETGVESYKPFPPFYVPPEIKIPFEDTPE